ADRNRSHWSTSKTPSYTKSVSWQHHPFEPHYFMRVNDFNSSNGKDHHWEITNTFRYRINEHWLPYFELRWLDRNVEPYHREQNQIRIGTKYFF
ncbi:oligogalacturonate-specific porin KdgM family protein, partial [Escherichia coli]|uniref:oligogalacturonate-specific porin KdgM family protein n=1 Tax=Escherichia coli TaxID=562 RepID=UPI0023DE0EA9